MAREISTIAIVGAGFMGAGIAQLAVRTSKQAEEAMGRSRSRTSCFRSCQAADMIACVVATRCIQVFCVV